MRVSRVELKTSTERNRQVVIAFSPEYKLAKGYTQRITVVERVPKIDGFTMPPSEAWNKWFRRRHGAQCHV